MKLTPTGCKPIPYQCGIVQFLSLNQQAVGWEIKCSQFRGIWSFISMLGHCFILNQSITWAETGYKTDHFYLFDYYITLFIRISHASTYSRSPEKTLPRKDTNFLAAKYHECMWCSLSPKHTSLTRRELFVTRGVPIRGGTTVITSFIPLCYVYIWRIWLKEI